jgi:hypothetical protein
LKRSQETTGFSRLGFSLRVILLPFFWAVEIRLLPDATSDLQTIVLVDSAETKVRTIAKKGHLIMSSSNVLSLPVPEVGAGQIEFLNEIERETLVTKEHLIERHLSHAVEVGAALKVIRDGRLYRETHPTFEAYLAERFDLSRSYAYGLIDAAAMHENLNEHFDVLPVNEFQGRPMAKLTPDQQINAWGKVMRGTEGKNPTNKIVKAVVREMVEEAKLAAKLFDADLEAKLDTDNFLSGNPLELMDKIAPGTGDLLLIGNPSGSTNAAAGSRLSELLTVAAVIMKPDHQLLIFSNLVDDRPFLTAAEAKGYEVGVPFRWISDATRSPLDWSAKSVEHSILHLRRGNAGLVDRISNVIECDEEISKLHPAQRPLALIRTLIEAATRAGDTVIDPTAGAATANIACRQLGRNCIGIESDPQVYQAGIERLAEFDHTNNLDDINQ